MIFNSIEFFTFFVIVFSVYFFLLKEKTKPQNILLLVASYVFYGWANWKILPLLAATTLGFYGLGIVIHAAKTDKHKQLFTILGVVFGIGTLLYFKYFNFFIASFKDLFESFGLQTNLHTFKIIVPVGISFYTFRLLSYVIDIYREKTVPTRNIIEFATYVAFFPCLLAGPIDRPATLIPQLQNKRVFDYTLAVDGMRQILWGLFKKVAVADNCALFVNQLFDAGILEQTSSTLLISAIFYTFQLYADFSGYSDMAIGVAKLLGFHVTKNFDFPFFAQNISEYWRKWHISLTSWLTDYVFMPLNIKWRGSGNLGTIASIMTTYILIGLWHGDNWTFVVFGLYHGLLYVPLILSGAMFKKNKIVTNKLGISNFTTLFRMLFTFSLVTLGNIIFRAENLGQAFEYLKGITRVSSLFVIPTDELRILKNIFVITCMLVVEWIERKNQFGFEKFGKNWKPVVRYTLYYVIILLIILSFKKEQVFIYFRF